MKYLRLFENESDYTQWGGGTDYVEPHVVLISTTDKVFYKQLTPPPPPPAQVGDIAYWDGSTVKTIPLSSWNSSLGTPVGVVMIGEGFAPDGKARIISLTNMSYNGSEYISWDYVSGNYTGLPNFKYVPTTDNVGSTTTGVSNYGYLPSDSDNFTGDMSFVDMKTKYNNNTPYIPSPYLGDVPNPAYYQAIEGGNALSDFNGLSNTQLLVNAGSNYRAAHACWNYKDATNGADGLQWYLPTIGELGYLMPRFKQINESIQAVSGVPVEKDNFWSSSDKFDDVYYARVLHTMLGSVSFWAKDESNFARSVALL